MSGYSIVEGSIDDLSGSCVATRLNGDQAYWVMKDAGKMGAEIKGTSTYVGGTGKLAGIQGTVDWTQIALCPAAEGTTQGMSRWKTSCKLP